MKEYNTQIPKDASAVYWKDIEHEWKGTNSVCGYIKNGMIYFFGSVAEQLYLKNGMHSNIQTTDKQQQVYFMQADNGMIKIGKSMCAEDRLKQLKTLSPADIVLIDAPLCNDSESKLHKIFAHLRHHGEWFIPGQDLINYIHNNKGIQQ